MRAYLNLAGLLFISFIVACIDSDGASHKYFYVNIIHNCYI